ncbi:HEAT repeat domain-containing protein [Candidatus Uabimicrobium sp. HlEnr_7]|uniref:HEAT repeat domain-containing protein n=1 Tax=Candidatus Uabimicrobium helgolandensis TaxID=3095367 RepID=UPI003557812D
MIQFIICLTCFLTIGCSSFHYVKTGDSQAPIEQIVAAGDSEDLELAPGLKKLLQNRISKPETLGSEKTIETIIAIGKLDSNSATVEFVKLLRDEDEEVRFHSVEALSNIRESSVVQALITTSIKDEDDLVADAASRALSKLTLTPIHNEDGENQVLWGEWWKFNSKYFIKE